MLKKCEHSHLMLSSRGLNCIMWRQLKHSCLCVLGSSVKVTLTLMLVKSQTKQHSFSAKSQPYWCFQGKYFGYKVSMHSSAKYAKGINVSLVFKWKKCIWYAASQWC